MEMIIFNGPVYAGNGQILRAEAVAVQDGKIAAVGPQEEVFALKKNKTRVVDLQGRCLLPGFNDSHLHLIGYALTAAQVDLRNCRSIEEVVIRIRSFIEERKIESGSWVMGWGWDHRLYPEGRMPGCGDLDRASTDHYISIMRTCCHILSANTPSLRQAGIYQNPPAMEGGEVETGAGGTPTGVLKEKAMHLVTDLLPPLNTERLKGLIINAGRDFLASGLTSVQTDDLAALGSEKLSDLLEAYRDLEESGLLPLRINLQPLLQTTAELESFLARGLRTGQGSPYFKIGPLKLLVDGSLGGSTALLSQPYLDSANGAENCGVPVLNEDELKALVEIAHRGGMQIAAHAIGDAAVKMALKAYREANRKYSRTDPRFRIVHASLVDDEALDSFAAQQVIADIQPSFIASDYELIERRLGSGRVYQAYRWKDFYDRGIVMGGGSDCPVENYNPLEGITVAVTRQDKQGRPPGGWQTAQKLSLEQALALYTRGSAYCTYEETVKGAIAPGMFADLVVLAEDIFHVDAPDVGDIPVDMTVVGGRVVYERLAGN